MPIKFLWLNYKIKKIMKEEKNIFILFLKKRNMDLFK